MGKSSSKLPPLADRDLRVLLSYNLEERHLKALWRKFVEIDTALNGVWTVTEVYRLINEPRMSIRAPILDRIFFMGDGDGEGAMQFQDFLVAFTSFCALSKEEVLQLLFMIVDEDRNGTCEKSELLEFFSYMPEGSRPGQLPLFPVNNKNALDKFRKGNWESLEFDGVAQLCNRFPYISYPAYHVQEQFRKALLGIKHWEKLDADRMIQHGMPRKVRKITLPGSKEKITVIPPGRCTMAEFLEYSRRKTKIANGKRVQNERGQMVSTAIAKELDDEIARGPLANMIRNPRCMYHVPYQPTVVAAKKSVARPELEVAGALENPDRDGMAAMNQAGIPSAIQDGSDDDDDSDEDSHDSDDSDDD